MRRLVVDIGNSKLAAAVAEGNQLVQRFSQPYGFDGRGGPERAVAALGDWSAKQLLSGGLSANATASVVPPIGGLWRELWRGREVTSRIPLVEINHESPLPYRLEIREPATVGADRLCNVAAAVRRGLSDAIVIDLGTAHTYDILHAGAFVGGLIAPGAVSAHEALLGRAAQLPPVSFMDPRALVGDDTAASIQAGSFHQAVGGIFYLIHRLERRYPGLPVLATGGLAELLAPILPDTAQILPDLTLEGALAILDAATAAGQAGATL